MTETHTYSEAEQRTDGTGDWLAIGQAARLIGLSVSTLRRYDESGLLKAHRSPSGHRRYRRADVLAAVRTAA